MEKLEHPVLTALAEATRSTPYEGQLWIVGGAVRDALLGRPIKNDFDLVSELDAAEIAAFLAHKMGLPPPETYPRFGTAMIRVEGSLVELVQARRESYNPDSRKPDVEPATLLDDARRRDFTVNALMQNLHSGERLDLLGCGRSDLDAGLLRTPLEPEKTFFDDPLRMLRAVRFRWTLGFDYVPELEHGIVTQAFRLPSISAERIKEEFVKMLLLQDADRALEDLLRLGLLEQFAPELAAMVGVEQGRYHHLDVWGHTLKVIRNAGPGDLLLTLACLLHDVGKPSTRSIDADGNTRFFTHELVGAEMTRTILRHLTFSLDDVEIVAKLVRNHMRLGSAPVFSPQAARRLIRDMGDELDRLLQLVDADAAGLKADVRVMDLQAIRAQIQSVLRVTPAETLVSPLSGSEIMEALQLEPGPQIGAIKQWLSDQVVEGTLTPGDKEGATAMLPIALAKTGA